MGNIKLTVIIPCFNGEEFIDRCLMSLCNQTLESIEVIVIDDCSTDNSLEILQKWRALDQRVKVLKNETNSGSGFSRNKAFREAQGEYITFVDVDDYLYDEYFFRDCIQRLDESAADILITPFYRYQKSRYRKDSFRLEGYYSGYRAAQKYIDRDFGTHASTGKFYRKSQLKASFVECGFSQDVLFVFRALLNADKVYAYPRYGYVYYNDNVSAWRPKAVTTEHALSSIRLLTEVLLCLDVLKNNNIHIDPTSFLTIWNTEHGDRLEKYIKTYGGLGFRQLDEVMKDGWGFIKKYISDETIQSAIRRESREDNESNQDLIAKYANYLKKVVNGNQRETASIPLIRSRDISTFKLPYEVIVSLTTYPRRIHIVHKVIKSLMNQTVQVNNIILWLSDEDFPSKEQELPASLTSLIGERFQIKWCPNLKPHKKYFYAMKESPDSIIITVDDDVYYANDLIEDLIQSYIKNPEAVSAKRCHLITFGDDGELMPYANWVRGIRTEEMKSPALLPTGVGGVLYPPKFYEKTFFNEALIRETCINQDDLWLRTIGLKKDIPVVVTKNPMCNVMDIEESQEEALWSKNIDEGNDISLLKIKHFITQEFSNEYQQNLKEKIRKESIRELVRINKEERLFDAIQFNESKLMKYRILSKVCFWGKRDYYKDKLRLMNMKRILK